MENEEMVIKYVKIIKNYCLDQNNDCEECVFKQHNGRFCLASLHNTLFVYQDKEEFERAFEDNKAAIYIDANDPNRDELAMLIKIHNIINNSCDYRKSLVARQCKGCIFSEQLDNLCNLGDYPKNWRTKKEE